MASTSSSYPRRIYLGEGTTGAERAAPPTIIDWNIVVLVCKSIDCRGHKILLFKIEKVPALRRTRPGIVHSPEPPRSPMTYPT
jgi:hypothetical protein